MKKLMTAVVGLALCAGCSTAVISQPGSLQGVDVKGAGGKADRTLCVANEGYFFLNHIPIFSSSMDWDKEKRGIDPWALSLFKDETSLQRMTDAFYKYADRENCDVVDIVVDNQTIYPLDISGVGGFIRDLFSIHEMTVTGVLKPRP